MANSRIQDLARFRLPDHFRGRNAATCQLWWLIQDTLFRWSPQFAYPFRRMLLRLFGAKIGARVLIRSTAKIHFPWRVRIGENAWIGDGAELYSLANIEIGDNAVVSQRAFICTGSHDYTLPDFPIVAKPIIIGEQAWICADVMVMPGVTIGVGAVVSARSLVTKSLPAERIAMGSPARDIGPRIADDHS